MMLPFQDRGGLIRHLLLLERGIGLAACLLLVACAGCGGSADEPPPQDSVEPQQQGMTAAQVMEKVVATYREADSYIDNAEYGSHFVLASDGVQRQGLPISVSVLFERPNRFRIARVEQQLDGTAEAVRVVSDGDTLEANIDSLVPQRLSLDAPQEVTLDSICPDPVLRESLFPVPVQDIFPQLALLLADEEHPAWPLQAVRGLSLLPEKDIQSSGGESRPCFRVQVSTTAGPQICWVDQETFLLLRIEIPSEDLAKQNFPNQEFSSYSLRFDFYDVALGVQVRKGDFQLHKSGDEELELVKQFTKPAVEEAADESQPSEAESAEPAPDGSEPAEPEADTPEPDNPE